MTSTNPEVLRLIQLRAELRARLTPEIVLTPFKYPGEPNRYSTVATHGIVGKLGRFKEHWPVFTSTEAEQASAGHKVVECILERVFRENRCTWKDVARAETPSP